MKTFILLNAIIEISAGLIFLIIPTLIPGVSETDITGFGYARMYGAGAIAFAAMNFQIWKTDNQDIFPCFSTTKYSIKIRNPVNKST